MKKGKALSTNKELMSEWNFEKNDALGFNPNELTFGSLKKVWWKCKKCGNEREAKISNRTLNNRGCPYCSNQKIKVGFNDLATTNPELLKEWDFEKNEILPTEVTHGSGKKVWWKCPNGHSYQATILHRTNGKTGCPECNKGRQTSFAEQAIYFYIKKAFPAAINRYKDIFNNGMELDIYIPSFKIGIEYDGYYWHKKEKEEREIRKHNICKENGIKLIRIKESGINEDKDLLTADIIFHGINLENEKNLETSINYLLCEVTKFTNRPFPLFPFEINLDKDRLLILNEYRTNSKKDSLKELYPEIAEEWNYEKNKGLKPESFNPGSSISVFWKCKKCGHEWKTSINHRKSGSGCPKCYRENNRGKNIYNAKKIHQYSLEGEYITSFDCISDAARQYKINGSNITSCAQHKRPYAGGFRWEYEKVDCLRPLEKKKKKSRLNTNGKAVIQLDENGNIVARYKSMSEAGRILGKDASSITRVIKGQLKTFAGYYWKLDENNDD